MNRIILFLMLSFVVLSSNDLLADRIFWGDGNWGNTNYIKSCNLDGSDITTVIQLTTGFYGAMDVDIDKTNSKVYWVSPWGVIERSNLDGTGYQRITTVPNAWVENVCVNEVNSKVYFTNANIVDAICRINFDGSGYTELIPEFVLCFDIDPIHNKIYYVTLYYYMPPWGNQAGRIWQSNLDGSDSKIIFQYNDNEWPERIALNLTEQKIYWHTTRGKFQRADVDGSNPQIIFTPPQFYCTGMVIDEKNGKMYWINYPSKKIQRANLDGTGMEDVVTATGASPYGIDILIENNIPVADAGPDQTAYARINGIADVALDGSDSNDPDGDELTYKWTWTIDANTYEANGVSPTIELPVGEYVINLIVNDGSENSEPNSCVITVLPPIETQIRAEPGVISARKLPLKISVKMELPSDVGPFDFVTPMTLEPWGIEAYDQYLVTRGKNIFVSGFFVLDTGLELPPDSMTITAVGRLQSGKYIFGSDTVKVR